MQDLVLVWRLYVIWNENWFVTVIPVSFPLALEPHRGCGCAAFGCFGLTRVASATDTSQFFHSSSVLKRHTLASQFTRQFVRLVMTMASISPPTYRLSRTSLSLSSTSVQHSASQVVFGTWVDAPQQRSLVPIPHRVL